MSEQRVPWLDPEKERLAYAHLVAASMRGSPSLSSRLWRLCRRVFARVRVRTSQHPAWQKDWIAHDRVTAGGSVQFEQSQAAEPEARVSAPGGN